MTFTKLDFSNLIQKTLLKPIQETVSITPPENYSLIFLKNLTKGYWFRIIQNKNSGLIYYEYGKTYWKELNPELICTPINNLGVKLTVKEVKKLIEPYFEDLVRITKAQIIINFVKI
jgi:hypothetical protein